MKKHVLCNILLLLAIVFPSAWVEAGPGDVHKALVDGMKILGAEHGAQSLAVLTNANYARLQGKTTEGYVDMIAEATGCSIGRRNLLFVNLRVQKDLLVCLLDAAGDKCHIIRYDGSEIRAETIAMDEKLMRERGYMRTLGQSILGEDGFSVATILGAWEKGAPYDLLKVGELHSHICPGVIMGYIVSQAIMEHYPLADREDYYLIGSPNECKEDVYQVMLGITPGSGKMAIKHLGEGQVEENEKIKLMGILLRWSPELERRIGVVLGINRDAMLAVTKLDKKMERGLKLAAIFDLIEYLPHYNDFFIALKEFPVDPGLRRKLMLAGVNPYEELDLQGGTPE